MLISTREILFEEFMEPQKLATSAMDFHSRVNGSSREKGLGRLLEDFNVLSTTKFAQKFFPKYLDD